MTLQGISLYDSPLDDNIIPVETRIDWDYNSQFRRYVVMNEPPSPRLLEEIFKGVSSLEKQGKLAPYTLQVEENPFIKYKLIPSRDDLEPFIFGRKTKIAYAKTARDPEHDAALNKVMGVIHRALRNEEHLRMLEPYTIGNIHCDDCGAHPRHRSRRMLRNDWPVADGSYCSPWESGVFPRVYG